MIGAICLLNVSEGSVAAVATPAAEKTLDKARAEIAKTFEFVKIRKPILPADFAVYLPKAVAGRPVLSAANNPGPADSVTRRRLRCGQAFPEWTGLVAGSSHSSQVPDAWIGW